ncbi:ABC transporter ATP-binding protein [Weeksellaceae bacterium A-14]
MLLEIKNLYFSYRPDKPLFQNLNLSFEQGKIIALAGESGCGKSTLLNLMYGLNDWQKGEILFDGISLKGPKGNLVPGEKDMKSVAQNYDLMPYATVYDNVGKFLSNINLRSKREKVTELLSVVGMENYANILPKNLSGGQQQRVAIARALSVTPKMLLLDEPFSNLDYSRKVELREKLFSYVRKENLTLVISTHEIQEIMSWLDRIVVLQDGRLIQNDSPQESYFNPYNDYVARLFGEVNIFSEEERLHWNLNRIFYYPHEIQPAENGMDAQVAESRFAGSHYWNKIIIDGKSLVIYTRNQISGTVKLQFSER